MMIKSFGIPDRMGLDSDVISRFFLNCRAIGKKGDVLQSLKGLNQESIVLEKDPSGNFIPEYAMRFGDTRYANLSSGYTWIAVYGNEVGIYDAALGKFRILTWRGALTEDYDSNLIHFFQDKFFIGNSPTGTPAMAFYLDRQAADSNGYFENYTQFQGYWLGEEELPSFALSNFCGEACMWESKLEKADFSNVAAGHGADDMLLVTGQFVFEGGQTSKFNSEAVLQFAAETSLGFSADIRLCVPQTGFDYRLTGIDLYACKVPEGAINNTINYPGLSGGSSVPTRGLSDEMFGAMPWQFLKRININLPLTHTTLLVHTLTTVGYSYSSPVVGSGDASMLNLPQNAFSTGDYDAYIKPVDGSDDWVYVSIDSAGQYSSSSEKSSVIVRFSSTLGANYQNKLCYVAIVSRWLHKTNTRARGVISITDETALSGKTVTINGQVLTEGAAADWDKSTSPANAATNLAAAINGNALTGVTATAVSTGSTAGNTDDTALVWLKANSGGASGNNIDTSTNATGGLYIHNSHLTGGLTGNYHTIELPWLFAADSNLELSDPILDAQPWSLVEEYHPNALLQCHQDRRRWLLDCTTDKRYKNMLMYSEVDMPLVLPNRNAIMLNAEPGEDAKFLLSVRNSILAGFENTIHHIRMTGEPVQYDEEKGVFDEGCAFQNSAIVVDGIAYWIGYDGIKAFTGEVKDLTEQTFHDDMIDLIQAQYTGASGYTGVYGGYCQRKQMIFWTFPDNSTFQIDGYTVNMIALDLRNGAVIVYKVNRIIESLFPGPEGKLFGYCGGYSEAGGTPETSRRGFYEITSDSSTENLVMAFHSGAITSDNQRMDSDILVERISMKTLGTFTVTPYIDKDTSPADATTFSAQSVFKKSSENMNVKGDEIELRIASSSVSTERKLGRIELEIKEMP